MGRIFHGPQPYGLGPNDETVKMIKLPLLKLQSMRISLLGYRFLSDICCLYCPVLYIEDQKNEEVAENYDSVDNDKVGGFEK